MIFKCLVRTFRSVHQHRQSILLLQETTVHDCISLCVYICIHEHLDNQGYDHPPYYSVGKLWKFQRHRSAGCSDVSRSLMCHGRIGISLPLLLLRPESLYSLFASTLAEEDTRMEVSS